MVKKNNWYSFENVAYIQLIKILITEAFIFALIVLMVFAKPNILKIYIVTSHLRTRRQTLIVLPWEFAAFWLSEAEQNSWRICNGIKIKVLRGWKYIKVGPICHYCDLILPKLGFCETLDWFELQQLWKYDDLFKVKYFLEMADLFSKLGWGEIISGRLRTNFSVGKNSNSKVRIGNETMFLYHLCLVSMWSWFKELFVAHSELLTFCCNSAEKLPLSEWELPRKWKKCKNKMIVAAAGNALPILDIWYFNAWTFYTKGA